MLHEILFDEMRAPVAHIHLFFGHCLNPRFIASRIRSVDVTRSISQRCLLSIRSSKRGAFVIPFAGQFPISEARVIAAFHMSSSLIPSLSRMLVTLRSGSDAPDLLARDD